jgi:hypothetical protein
MLLKNNEVFIHSRLCVQASVAQGRGVPVRSFGAKHSTRHPGHGRRGASGGIETRPSGSGLRFRPPLAEKHRTTVSAPAFVPPAWIFHGLHDDLAAIECARAFADSHPNVRLSELDSGHDLVAVLDGIIGEGFLSCRSERGLVSAKLNTVHFACPGLRKTDGVAAKLT